MVGVERSPEPSHRGGLAHSSASGRPPPHQRPRAGSPGVPVRRARPTAPTRLDQYHLQYGKSEAEFDPHAFLSCPATDLLVIPVTTRGATGTTPPTRPGQPAASALILTVLAGKITLLGTIAHPSSGDPRQTGLIRRSLIINQTLWTFSDAGLAANDTTTMDTLAWLPS